MRRLVGGLALGLLLLAAGCGADKVQVATIKDPGPGKVYQDCRVLLQALDIEHLNIVRNAEAGDLTRAGRASWRYAHLVDANPTCVDQAQIALAREVLGGKSVNALPPNIEDIPGECQQAFADGVRLLGIASGMKRSGVNYEPLATGFDVIAKKNPHCFGSADVRRFRELFAAL